MTTCSPSVATQVSVVCGDPSFIRVVTKQRLGARRSSRMSWGSGTPSSCGARLGAARSAVVAVETAAGLAAEQPGVDHPAEEGRRRIQRLLELLVERLGDGLGGVEPDEVREGERSLRVRGAADEAGVDVVGGGEAGLEHANRTEYERDQQRVDDEAGAVLRLDGVLVELVGDKGPRPLGALRRGEEAG